MTLSPAQLAAYLDSTNLRLDATEADIRHLCDEAVSLGCACVMIYPASVPLASDILKGTGMKIGTVIGFPSGRFSTAGKAAEIDAMAKAGAHEVDIVMNYAALREGHEAEVAAELTLLSKNAHAHGQLVKVITENCYLNEAQMLSALRLCEAAGVDFIKTSTGFGSSGAKIAHIALWSSQRKGKIRIKAAGGIKSLQDALSLIAAGAERLGTSSSGAIIAELKGAKSAAASTGY
jgi:deoxyribose-phosphate aldolase